MTIKTIFLDEPPSGTNKLGSRSGFVQRIAYENYFQKFLKLYEFEEKEFFDGRNKDVNYGRKDYYNNTIHVSEAFLKNLPGSDEYKALNFVSDAFEHFKYLMDNASLTKGLISDTYKNIRVKNGLKNVHKKYHDHMNKLYEAYLKHSTLMRRDKKIIDFLTFLNNFISFLDVVGSKTPFLKSSFITSRELSVIDTGLVVEIEDTTKDKDEDKFKKYYNTPDFLLYYSYASRTGFKIDRDCPWRLVFDVKSESSKKYMSEYQMNGDDIFEDYYHKTNEYDLDNLKLYLIMFYNSYATSKPTVATPKTISENNVTFTTSEIKNRNQITVESVDSIVRKEYWFKLMCYIKLLENKVSLSQQQYENEIEIIINQYNKYGFAAGLGMLNKLIEKSERSDTKMFMFT
jgi:hypothetical protein